MFCKNLYTYCEQYESACKMRFVGESVSRLFSDEYAGKTEYGSCRADCRRGSLHVGFHGCKPHADDKRVEACGYSLQYQQTRRELYSDVMLDNRDVHDLYF